MRKHFTNFFRVCLPLFALAISVDITPEATQMLLERHQGEKDVWITSIFYA